MGKYMVTAIILTILIFILLLMAGCTNSHIIPEENLSHLKPVVPKVPLQDALDALSKTSTTGRMSAQPPQIYYIHGYGLDLNGSATDWIFGIVSENSSFFYSYRAGGESITKWPDTFPYTQINPSTVIKPHDLFSSHKLLLQDLTNMGNRDVDELRLMDNVYTLSIKSDTGFRMLRYDATTGNELE